MRKLGIAILVLLVLVVLAAAILPRFVDVNRYRGRIQAELEQRLNRPVQLGAMNLSLFPPAFRVQNAVIGEDKSFNTGRPFAQAQELFVTAKLGPLLKKELEISRLELRKPQVEMVRNQQGIWNFASLGNRTVNGATTPPPQAPQNQPVNQQKKFELAVLKIIDGSVAVTDLQKHQSRAVYDHIDLTLRDYAQGKPFSVVMEAHLPGQGKQVARLDGKGGPIDDASMLNTSFNGTLKLEQVSLSAAQKFLNSEALEKTDAIVSGTAQLKNEGGKLASSGSLKLENPRIRGVDVGYPITADYDVSDDLTNDVIQITRATLRLGNTPLSIAGSVNTRNTPALMDMRVQASDVSIAEAARLAGAFGVGFSPAMQVAGRMNANLHAQGSTSSPSMNGTLAWRELVVTGKDLPQPVKVNAIELALAPDAIRSNDFTASTGGTSVNGRFTLGQYTTKAPTIDAVLRTANANIAELINMARAYGVPAVDGMNGSGSLTLDVHATGPVKNSAAMNFSGTGQIANASLKTATLARPVNVRNANLRFTKNSMVMENVAASVGSTNASGTMTMRNFEAPNVQFALSADKLDVIEMQQIMGAGAPQPAPHRTASLGLIPEAHAQAAATQQPSIITKMTGGGTVQIGTVLYDQLALNNVRSNVTLNNGMIRLAPVTAVVYGGNETGTIELDMRQPQTLYNVNLRLQNVDANKLLASVSSVKEALYGLLAANTQATFTSVPKGQDIARTLNGRMSLNLHDGKLANVDMLQQLSAIGKFQSLGRTAQNFTNLSQLTGDFDVRNGVASTNNLKALIDGGTLAATGAVSLVDQSVNMRVTAVLSKSYSEQVGGTGVGGFMQTALANNKGELVLPVMVTGTFQKLQFQPDMAKVAEMKMQNLLPSFSNPGQLSSGILGAVMGNKGGGQVNGQGGVAGIVDALTGKPKPNQQYPAGQAQPQTQTQQQAKPQTQQNSTSEAVGNLLNQVLGGAKKKQQQQQQEPQPR
ncbi:MAG TPA: AsmA family protein [Clostridia bacterium]|nr:AsmA family protein [Clostridia bacterium]